MAVALNKTQRDRALALLGVSVDIFFSYFSCFATLKALYIVIQQTYENSVMWGEGRLTGTRESRI